MNFLRITSTLFIFLFAPHFVFASENADDLAKMRGRWKVTSAIRDGVQSKAGETDALSFVIEGDRMTIDSDGHKEQCRIVLDPTKSPGQIELIPLMPGGTDEKSVHGIYAFEGQALKLAWTKNGRARPTKFAAEPGEELNVVVLERAAPSAPATALADADLQKELAIVLLNVVEYPSDETNSMVQTLLAEGADVNICSGRQGYAPLHGLANLRLWAQGRFESWHDAAAALLAAGADVNQKTKGGGAKDQTPLHVLADAASEAQSTSKAAQFMVKAAEFFVQHGADPSIRDADGKTPLDLVANVSESPLKKELTELFSHPPVRVKAAPVTRPALIDARSVTLDLNQCALNVIEYPPDDAATLIDCLLKAGADPHDGMGIGEALLGSLAFNAGNTWQVSKNDWRHAAAALIKAGADVNRARGGTTPLDEAIETAALNAEYHHSTPNEIGMAQFLMENGADPSIKDPQGQTARDRAAKIADGKVRQELLDLMDKAK